VNVAADPEATSSFYIMAQGAVAETPMAENSVVYEHTGAVQTFEVPDNVEEVTIETIAGGGAGGGASGGGAGGMVTATFPVIPGTVYNVYVGGQGSSPFGGFPNGGNGGTANNDGDGGGGASYVIEAGADLGSGGVGGFLEGGDGNVGQGATQSAPGAGGGGGDSGDTDGVGFGGDGQSSGPSPVSEGGGGGGGYHGGGAGGNSTGQGSGGGGSGWCDPSGTDLELADGVNTGHGQITVSWEDPLDNV
jgi:hypothetical protein